MCGEPTPKPRPIRADRRVPVAKAKDPREATAPPALLLVLALLAAVFAVVFAGR